MRSQAAETSLGDTEGSDSAFKLSDFDPTSQLESFRTSMFQLGVSALSMCFIRSARSTGFPRNASAPPSSAEVRVRSS